MNMFKRILFAIYAFFIAIISAILLILPFSRKFLDSIVTFLDENVYISFYSRVVFFAIIALFLLISVLFLFSGFKKSKFSLSVTKATELGELSISLASVESIALTSLKNVKGIKEIKVDASRFSDGVSILIKLIVFPEVIITEMTKKIQTVVTSDVETATGVKVQKVVVKIDNVTNYTMRSTQE